MQTKVKEAVDINTAIDAVLALAEQGMTDRLDNPTRYRVELAAIELVRETFGRAA